MTVINRRVLICGASIAGPTLAYWLARHGFLPTVVERGARPRLGGYPIDVRGHAVDVAERMGILPDLRQAATETNGLTFVDATGRTTGKLDMAAVRRAAPTRDIELPRGDLCGILHTATRDDAEYLFDDSIRDLRHEPDGITVEFTSGATRRFDLVVGADGLHSTVRRLEFGDESAFIHHLGYAVAVVTLDDVDDLAAEHWITMYNTPGRLVGVGRWGGKTVAMFMYQADGNVKCDKDSLLATFPEDDWHVRRLLARAAAAEDLYFDTVSQIRMPRWSKGRVALVGDAAYCPALLSGAGSSLAMTGAYLLAGELKSAAGNHEVAFPRYEQELRPAISRGQRGYKQSATMLIPHSTFAIWRRNQLCRLAAPLAAVGSLLPSRNTPALRDYDERPSQPTP